MSKGQKGHKRFSVPMPSSSLVIRPLALHDFPHWLPLWDGNNLGRRDEALTTETWTRLLDSDYPVYGLAAVHQGEIAGIMHYVLHPTTGNIHPVCYMQDLFVSPDHRKKGIARRLVQELAAIAHQEKWARVYWLADAKNEGAQALYKDIGVRLNFTFHVLPVH